MFMSLDTTAGKDTPAAFSAAVKTEAADAAVTRWYMRTRLLLALWVVLSIGWGGAVSYDLYQRVAMQADMSRDVESDLDQGFVSASCVGTECGGIYAKTAETWNLSGIFSTYLKFGSDEMAAWAFGPPATLLLLGIGAAVMLRRRARRLS